MKQNPSWEANRSSGNQNIPRILWSKRVHCRIYNSPPPVPILNQSSLVYVVPNDLLKTILILSSHLLLGLPSCLFPFRFPHPYIVCTFPLLYAISFMISAPRWYLVSSINHKAPRCALTSIPLLPRPFSPVHISLISVLITSFRLRAPSSSPRPITECSYMTHGDSEGSVWTVSRYWPWSVYGVLWEFVATSSHDVKITRRGLERGPSEHSKVALLHFFVQR